YKRQGEFVIIVEGARLKEPSIKDAMNELKELINKGHSRKEASREVAKKYGLKSKILYDQTLNN
ncbi:MAG: DUF434 domain-containing protein, partial [Thermodesulfovibrionales bacterium]|nr:DUF434 domain-containing protein [Thermodesulfovibrionales bacterium]